MIKLKPCPFCGDEAALAHGTRGITATSYVRCTNFMCGVHGKEYDASPIYASDDKAVEFWNDRATERG